MISKTKAAISVGSSPNSENK